MPTHAPSLLIIAGLALAAFWSPPGTAAPDEEALGKSAGYPVGTPRSWFLDEKVRVGSFSHLDRILPHNVLARSAAPLKLETAASIPRISYRFENQTLTVGDFLTRQRITGLMILKDGKVLAEHYQYDRTADHRLVSHSMAKSLVSLAICFALAEHKIRSLDEKVATYVPDLAGSAYGESTIRSILRMASGVKFSELYDGKDDLARFGQMRATAGTIPALRLFNER